MTEFKKLLTIFLSVVLCLTLLAGCKDDNGNDPVNSAGPADGTEAPSSADDDPLTTEIVAKLGGNEIYSNEFYYFLYSALREIYYSTEGIYDSELSDEENYKRMLEHFRTEREDGTMYLDDVIERALEITAGFKVASILGKRAGEENSEYALTAEEISEMNKYIDSEADYGASVYSSTRDEYFFYAYGMGVNDAKRYTEAQMYAEKHEAAWSDANGFVIGVDKPEEPEKPTEPAENADDAAKKEYETKLTEYETAVAEYNTKLAEYEAAAEKYWNKFRDEYESAKSNFNINTVRYLYLSKLDGEGKALSDEELKAKEADIDRYIELVKGGLNFENVVKGFSESSTAGTDLGLWDINMYSDSDPKIPTDAIKWAMEQTAPSDELKIFSDENGYYIVQLVGVTDFDATAGIVADSESTSSDAVKSNVEYTYLARLYNEFIEEQLKKDEFAVTDKDYEQMKKLANEYLDYNSDAFENNEDDGE